AAQRDCLLCDPAVVAFLIIAAGTNSAGDGRRDYGHCHFHGCSSPSDCIYPQGAGSTEITSCVHLTNQPTSKVLTHSLQVICNSFAFILHSLLPISLCF